MLSFDEILARRHSVRAYSRRPVRHDDLLSILEAARLAPSACNSQTWRFIAVTDGDMIERICQQAMRPVIPNKWLATAPLVIIGCSQLDLIANCLGAGITGIEYYQIDLGIAMEHMVLKATELGLGTCWIGWFKEERVKQLLAIPSRAKVSAMLAIGYPKYDTPKAHKRKRLEQIVFAEKWGQTIK